MNRDLNSKEKKRSLVRLIAAVLCFAASIFLCLSFYSFDYLDPSLNRATDRSVHNLGGSYGAILTDLLYQLFGLASIIIPLVLMIWSLILLNSLSLRFLPLRLVSLLTSVASFAAILAYFEESENWVYTTYGGVVGYKISDFTMRFIQSDYLYFAIVICIFSFLFASALDAKKIYAGASLIENWIVRLVGFISRVSLRLYNLVRRVRAFFTGKTKQTQELIEVQERTKRSIKSVKQKTATIEIKPNRDFNLPSFQLLSEAVQSGDKNLILSTMKKKTAELQKVLSDFGVKGEILSIHPGPVVTLFEFEPVAGTKSARVIGLADDIARVMHAASARIAIIPGRNAMGIELPNSKREIVYLRELFESDDYQEGEHDLPIVLGKSISGQPVVVDLAKMPHLLIAGTTGSGKSVGINTMILSLLYKLTPDQCKLLMIDPKVLELSVYDNIPHLISPVVTEPRKAIVALKWILREMENRYRLMSNLNVRNIKGFNQRIREALASGEKLEKNIQTGFDPDSGRPVFEAAAIELKELPYIVVIVDEMADLMLVAGKEIEASIQRIAQMARAAGIHLIMATQRPSVDVITGVIKANFPTRISFQVTSRIDSRTILGEQGAEQLLGMGDMLYLSGGGRISRVHGPFVSDKEIEKIVDHLRKQKAPDYIDASAFDDSEDSEFGGGGDDFSDSGGGADLYKQAVDIVIRDKKASTSYIQRRLRIGYNRAASLIERMEEEGVVSAPNHSGKREILADDK